MLRRKLSAEKGFAKVNCGQDCCIKSSICCWRSRAHCAMQRRQSRKGGPYADGLHWVKSFVDHWTRAHTPGSMAMDCSLEVKLSPIQSLWSQNFEHWVFRDTAGNRICRGYGGFRGFPKGEWELFNHSLALKTEKQREPKRNLALSKKKVVRGRPLLEKNV